MNRPLLEIRMISKIRNNKIRKIKANLLGLVLLTRIIRLKSKQIIQKKKKSNNPTNSHSLISSGTRKAMSKI